MMQENFREITKTLKSSVRKSRPFINQQLIFVALTIPKKDLINECRKSVNDDALPKLAKNPAYSRKYQNIFLLPTREDGLSIFRTEDQSKVREVPVQFQIFYPYSCQY